MEIRDYLRIIRRRLWILVLIPVLAGLPVFLDLRNDPPRYTALATVAAPALVGAPGTQYSGANGTRAFVANFIAAATSQRIRDRAAAVTGVPAYQIRGEITAIPVGESSLMHVRYETLRKNQASPVAKAVASETIRFLFETQVTLAQKSADEARKAVEEADAALVDFVNKAGVALPDAAYDIKAREISGLRQQVIEAEVKGDAAAAARYSAVIRTRQAELTDLAPKVTAYTALKDRKAQVVNQHNAALQNLQHGKAQFEAANPDLVVTAGPARQVPRSPQMIRQVGTAVGAGLFLATFVIVIFEVLSRTAAAAPSGRTVASPQPDDATAYRPGTARDHDGAPLVPAGASGSTAHFAPAEPPPRGATPTERT